MRTKQNHAHKGLADSGHEGNIPKSRSERRREDARRRLMKAAYEIIAQRGLEGLIVQDVTETADVGYGSFYNHFSSKEAIVEAVNHAANDYIKEGHRRLGSTIPDRVERFAMCLRMFLHLSKANQVWGWFVVRSMLSRQEFRSGIADALRQSIAAGQYEGVFSLDDPEMAYETIAALLLLGTLKLVSADVSKNYSDKLVRTALKAVGLPEAKIASLLSKPLPEFKTASFLEAAA